MRKVIYIFILFALSFGIMQNCRKDSEDSSTRIISLSGTLAFGSQGVGIEAKKQFIINNSGTESLTVSDITYPAGYSLDWKSGTISAGGKQIVNITFSPTEATTYNGNIEVKSDASSGTNSIAVSGIGVTVVNNLPKMLLDVNSLSFDNVTVSLNSTKTFSIKNTGTANLMISDISSSNNVFSISYPSTIITPGNSTIVNVTFTPSQAINYQAQLTINSNAGTQKLSLTGTGTTVVATPIFRVPETLNCGNVQVGLFNPPSFKLNLYNDGNAPLVINSITSSNNSIFYLSWSSTGLSYPMTITPTTAGFINVTFNPLANLYYTSRLTFSTNIGIFYVDVNGTGYGTISNPVSVPSIGYYTNCATFDNWNYNPTHGAIKAGIISIAGNQITFRIAPCLTSTFNYGGIVYITSNSNPTYNAYSNGINFYVGSSYVDITITDNNMTGTKTYYGLIYQAQNNGQYASGYSISPIITVKY